MKEWNRGRKPATAEQKQAAKDWQKIRVKITNAVSRDNTIQRKCCICNKDNAPILHNKENPYLITFICKECRKDKANLEKAEQLRFDLEKYKEQLIQDRKDNYYLDTKKFTKEEVKDIIEGYDQHNNMLTFGEYAELHNLSRHQFNQLQERYLEYFPDRAGVIDAIHNRSKAIQRQKLSLAATSRYLQLQKV